SPSTTILVRTAANVSIFQFHLAFAIIYATCVITFIISNSKVAQILSPKKMPAKQRPTTSPPPFKPTPITATASNKVWWANGAFVIVTHILAFAGLVFYRPKWETLVLMGVECWVAMMGITMGYHRLFSHRSFTASLPLRILLTFMGTLAFQGSIQWWVLRHRLHHRYTDDEENDPYAASKGFWFSHMGWIFERPQYKRIKLVEKKDLVEDPDSNTLTTLSSPSSLLLHFRLLSAPTASPTPSAHHEFPKDYRNGLHPLDYDPTKWCIYIAACLGLAWDLHKVPQTEIEKAKLLTIESDILERKRALDWGPSDFSLDVYTFSQYQQVVQKEGKLWMVVDGYILFMEF
ncbi:hypothetical protein HDV05_005305, partial [Chytridiales sp. JEL 0842]